MTHKQVLYRHLYPSIVLSYLHRYRLGHHWCRVVFWVKEMLFSRVLCEEPWMTAPVCTLGNFCVLLFLCGLIQACRILARTATAASNRPSCCSPEGLHQRSPALPLHAGNPGWHPKMNVCSLQRLEMCLCGLPTLISVTICANAERENGTNIFYFYPGCFYFQKASLLYFSIFL